MTQKNMFFVYRILAWFCINPIMHLKKLQHFSTLFGRNRLQVLNVLPDEDAGTCLALPSSRCARKIWQACDSEFSTPRPRENDRELQAWKFDAAMTTFWLTRPWHNHTNDKGIWKTLNHYIVAYSWANTLVRVPTHRRCPRAKHESPARIIHDFQRTKWQFKSFEVIQVLRLFTGPAA